MNINKNMLKLHRSDSMDNILEKINLENEDGKGSKYTSAGMINKLTLKLNDINKEFEYQESKLNRKNDPVSNYLWVFMINSAF